MTDLIERLRYEADISDRPGQMDRLNALADEFAAALEAARGERDALRGALEYVLEMLDLPEPNCSCHVAPPCSGCVEYGGLREAVQHAQDVISGGRGNHGRKG